MRTAIEISNDIKSNFEKRIQDTVAPGTVIDFYNAAVGEVVEKAYEEIEKNKNPHIWSNLKGAELDSMGTMLNIPRVPNESDTTYKYRILNWIPKNEASNTTAITDALLTPTYASNIEYRPYTKGSGTGTCYVIPKDYSSEMIEKALQEAAEKIKKVASPSLHVEYIIPTIKGIKLQIYMSSSTGDITAMRNNITSKIKEYINTIPPKEYLKVGDINKIGVNESNVEYFSVLSLMVNGVPIDGIQLLQEIDSKFLFDEIIWVEDN